MPLFMPSHLSKYIFPYSASVPMLDYVPPWMVNCPAGHFVGDLGESRHIGHSRLELCTGHPRKHSPLSLTTAAALRHFSPLMDFFAFPAVQHFSSIASLLEVLPSADVQSISAE